MQARGLGGRPCARLAPNHPSLQAALLGRWGRVLLEVGGQVLKSQVQPPAPRWTCGAVVSPVPAKEGSLGPAHQDVPKSSSFLVFGFASSPHLITCPPKPAQALSPPPLGWGSSLLRFSKRSLSLFWN